MARPPHDGGQRLIIEQGRHAAWTAMRCFCGRFPGRYQNGFTKDAFHHRYREGMIQHARVCVIIGGLKKGMGGVIGPSEGTWKEFQIAQSPGQVVVQIGASGGAARTIWEELAKTPKWSPAGITRSEFERLNDDKPTPTEAAQLAGQVLQSADNP